MTVLAGSSGDRRWPGLPPKAEKKIIEKTIIVYEDNPEAIRENKELKEVNDNLRAELGKTKEEVTVLNVNLEANDNELKKTKCEIDALKINLENSEEVKKNEKKSDVSKQTRSRRQG